MPVHIHSIPPWLRDPRFLSEPFRTHSPKRPPIPSRKPFIGQPGLPIKPETFFYKPGMDPKKTLPEASFQKTPTDTDKVAHTCFLKALGRQDEDLAPLEDVRGPYRAEMGKDWQRDEKQSIRLDSIERPPFSGAAPAYSVKDDPTLTTEERLVALLRHYPSFYNFYTEVNQQLLERLGHPLRIEIVQNFQFEAEADSYLGIIRIRHNDHFDEMFRSFIFELTNLFHYPDFKAIHEAAREGKIRSGLIYAYKIERTEEQGVQMVRVMAQDDASGDLERTHFLGWMGIIYSNANASTYGNPHGFKTYWRAPSSDAHINFYVEQFEQCFRS